MGLSFFDPRTGERRDFKPAAPPEVGLDAAGREPRERELAAAAARALDFLGLKAVKGRELRLGGKDPGPKTAWVKAAPVSGAWPADGELKSRGFTEAHVRLLFLKTHYRKPLAFSWEALAAARAEADDLRGVARSLAGVSLEPSSRGRAGYLHRFREALSRDLDFPEALACVWDALRPGALSPGSRASLLRETLPILGLSL